MLAATLPFTDWESFYVIVGSSAAALTGLQFVVMTLGAEARALGDKGAVEAFGTPTVVHFGAALLISAILSAPWHRLTSAAVVLGVCGLAGVAYSLVVIRRALRQSGYKPVLEDWIWHCGLPFLAYAILLIAAAVLPWHPEPSLFGVAATTLLLLYIGIHNSWDTVTFLAIQRAKTVDRESERK
jgi:drug/metabolite transporter (DMT)-like permease